MNCKAKGSRNKRKAKVLSKKEIKDFDPKEIRKGIRRYLSW